MFLRLFLLRAAVCGAAAIPLILPGCSPYSVNDRYGYDDRDDYDDYDDYDGACEDTPLVLSFDNSPVAYVELDSAYFDIGQHNGSLTTYWPISSTPWLARDVDGSGTTAVSDVRFQSCRLTCLAKSRRLRLPGKDKPYS